MARSFLYIPILLLGLFASAQENGGQNSLVQNASSFNASGGNGKSSSGSVSYSVGVVSYAVQPSDYMVSPGIQHPIVPKILKNNEDAPAWVIAYPNPTTNYVSLDIRDFGNETARYQVFSSKGSVMKSGAITAKTTTLMVEHWSDATYYIKVSVINKFEEILQIIKR